MIILRKITRVLLALVLVCLDGCSEEEELVFSEYRIPGRYRTRVKKYDENGNRMYSDNFYIINKTYLSYVQKVGSNYTIEIDTIFFGLTEDSIVFIPPLTITLESFKFSGYEHKPDNTQLAYFSVQETNFFVSEHYPSIFNDIDSDIENRFTIIGSGFIQYILYLKSINPDNTYFLQIVGYRYF